MKKNNLPSTAANQLSLFDNFLTDEILIENKKQNNDDTSLHLGWKENNTGQQPGDSGVGKLQGKTALFDAEKSPAFAVQSNGTGREVDSVPEPDKLAILSTGERTSIAGHDGIPGRGNGLAGSDGKGRLVNYYNTQPFYENLSFGKERHFKDNIHALNMLITLQEEKRAATEAEQGILAKYSGWGGLKEILLDPTVENN